MNSAIPPRKKSEGDGGSTESILLLARFVDGDGHAADELFNRYAHRLIALARSRLSAKLAARVSPDDIVMSAYRSFFIRARDNEFEVSQPGAVWRLLVQITLHKLFRQVEHHQAERRSVKREAAGGVEIAEQVLSREPEPDAAVALADEVEAWLSRLSPDQRQCIELKLQGASVDEIAQKLDRSTKTIRRHLEAAKRILLGLKADEIPAPIRATRTSPVRRRVASTLEEIPGVTNLRFEDYRLKKQIGVGLTGKVYVAQHHDTGKLVAIKYLKRRFTKDRRIIERFLSEVRLVTQLDHPGIIRIHGFGRTPVGGYFLAMDLSPVGDLGKHAGRHRLRSAEIVRWMIQAAEALDYSHLHHIIHCDLKPSNLLLKSNMDLIVSDFGFARQMLTGDVRDSSLAGTPAFMAPEQIDVRWGSISPLTDIYGLGAVLFFLLFDRPPILGRTISEVLSEVRCADEIRFPPLDRTDIQAELVAVCRDCLAKEPGRRIGSMSEFITRLKDTL